MRQRPYPGKQFYSIQKSLKELDNLFTAIDLSQRHVLNMQRVWGSELRASTIARDIRVGSQHQKNIGISCKQVVLDLISIGLYHCQTNLVVLAYFTSTNLPYFSLILPYELHRCGGDGC